MYIYSFIHKYIYVHIYSYIHKYVNIQVCISINLYCNNIRNTDSMFFIFLNFSRFLRALGIKALGFSPIRKSPILLHEHDEYIDESIFLEGCDVYVTLIRALSSQGKF
jgi:hypothetical protein